MICVWVTCSWCEKYLGFITNGLWLGELPMVYDWVTCLWFMIGWPACGFCSGNLLVVSNRVTCLWSLIRWRAHCLCLGNLPVVFDRVPTHGLYTCPWFEKYLRFFMNDGILDLLMRNLTSLFPRWFKFYFVHTLLVILRLNS
jgi:hypothetical protein